MIHFMIQNFWSSIWEILKMCYCFFFQLRLHTPYRHLPWRGIWSLPHNICTSLTRFFPPSPFLTSVIDRTGVNLTVVPPASSHRAAALLQGDVAGQHILTQVLIIQGIEAVLTLHWRNWGMHGGRKKERSGKEKREHTMGDKRRRWDVRLYALA